MLYDWYVFDLDGTISESDAGIIDCAEHAIDVLGFKKPSADDMRKFIGPPLKWSFMELAGMDEANAVEAIRIYREKYFGGGWSNCRMYAGIAQLIRGIKREGGHVALASSKPTVLCERILTHFGLRKFFDNVTGVELTDNSSDKSRLINKALAECADRPRAVVMGDRVYDRDGARDAGIDFVGVTYGYGVESEFEGAKFIADSPAALMRFFEIAPSRGLFVTFEGADGCGKTTQYNLAREYMTRRGWDIVATREPGGCRISEIIRNLVLDKEYSEMTEVCEALLYAAARAQHTREVIIPALEAGKTVLCDRFLDSSIAYQGAGRELNMSIIRQINEPAVAGLTPDMTLYFSCDSETSRARVESAGEPDRLESETDDFKSRVVAGFEALAASDADRIMRIDSTGDIETVFGATRRALDSLIGS